jgi:hypothetical protein
MYVSLLLYGVASRLTLFTGIVADQRMGAGITEEREQRRRCVEEAEVCFQETRRYSG